MSGHVYSIVLHSFLALNRQNGEFPWRNTSVRGCTTTGSDVFYASPEVMLLVYWRVGWVRYGVHPMSAVTRYSWHLHPLIIPMRDFICLFVSALPLGFVFLINSYLWRYCTIWSFHFLFTYYRYLLVSGCVERLMAYPWPWGVQCFNLPNMRMWGN